MKKVIHSDEQKLLTSWLIKQRKKANLTQRELASRLNVHHSIVGKIETGERGLNVIEFVEYCLTMGAEPNELLAQLMDMKG